MTAEPADNRTPSGDAAGPSGNHLRVAHAPGMVLVQVHGLGNMHVAPGLWTFCEHEIEAGARRFAFDLQACKSMDSTFMGCLVGLVMSLQDEEEPGWVCMINAGKQHRELLRMLGADTFLRFKADVEIADIEWQTLQSKPASPIERLERIKQAHENLVRIDERNAERFGGFLEALSMELDES